MAYLTFEEFKNFEPLSNLDNEEVFSQLLTKASSVIDALTLNFYQFNELEHDVEFRKQKFKQAVAAQVEYYALHGNKVTSHELSNAYQSFSIGRTSVNKGSSKNSSEEQNKSNPMISDDVYTYLSGTGLLYRGDQL